MSLGGKSLRSLAVTLLMIAGAGLLVGAQEQPRSPEKQQEASQQPGGPSHQLVHSSNEAAGDGKDAMAEFKHSASVRLISRWTHLGLEESYWLSMALNFAVIAGVLIWAGKKFLPGIFRDRTSAIQKGIAEAQKASAEAREKLAEIEARLQKLDVEIGMMRDAAEREGAAEEARIKAEAQEDARRIVAAAEQEIGAAAKAARRQLTAYAADLAVGLAERRIRVDAATDKALVRNFADELGSAAKPGKDGN
jgi:F-type H+-transporting ATPase subunit b